MQKQITSDNLDVTSSMVFLAEQKLEKLIPHFTSFNQDSIKIRVVLNKAPNEKFETKVELVVDGSTFFADSTEFLLETALINAIETVERQFIKQRDKTTVENWDKAREVKRFDVEEIDTYDQ